MGEAEGNRRRIVVVGGVAGGMSFAARARRLDEHADIVIFERGAHPSFANCGLPYFVSGEIADERKLLVQTPASLRAALNLDVRVGHEVVAVDTERQVVHVREGASAALIEYAYDELVLAPGTWTDAAAVPGLSALMSSGRAVTVRTVADAAALDALAESAQRAVVIGGGYIGVETAEALRMRGVAVQLVHRGAHVLSRIDPEQADFVARELSRHEVGVHCGAVVTECRLDGDAVRVALSTGDELTADIVINATGGTPATAFLGGSGVELDAGRIVVDDAGRTSVPHVWAVGDAVTHTDPITGLRRAVELAGPANRDGRLLADAMLAAHARPRPRPLATAVIRVFGLTVAATGASAADLVAAGMPFETVHLHGASHAGYFPGAQTVALVLHLAASGPERGRILGAQGVGRDGVDKRIDVIATAMRGGLHADDLIDLDLAYAPPYGSAKDLVNLAGMVAENILTGVTRQWYARDLAAVREEALILDVRRRDEWDGGHLPGALHVPHTELRERIDEVVVAAAGRPVRTHCAAGLRSYLAHRILTAAGLDSASLSGGMQTLLAVHGKDILTHADD